jgi:short-subunit dehydrogenase
MELKNKIAVITGASDGIGKQITLTLAKQGVNLVLIGRNGKRLKDVVKLVKNINSKLKVKSYSCDIRNGKKIKETVKQIIKDFKKIDILINVAGI